MLKKLLTVLCLTIALSPCYASDNTVQVMLTTNMGQIQLELYPDKSPETVKNFLSYVEEKYYDGLIFHRVINRFMIQAGGFNEDMTAIEPTREAIKNESANGLKNKKGTIAMARQQNPDSAKAQFYINVVDNWSLDANTHKLGYTVFGKVISGMNVAEKISKLPTQRVGGFSDVPTATVQILKARMISEK
ncbi:MAG: peptidylprolyl isomerase [Porticoccus sp.]|nr:peptidylprolyl isomerase [Porticoccus sp.]